MSGRVNVSTMDLGSIGHAKTRQKKSMGSEEKENKWLFAENPLKLYPEYVILTFVILRTVTLTLLMFNIFFYKLSRLSDWLFFELLIRFSRCRYVNYKNISRPYCRGMLHSMNFLVKY